jgi:hypothetical protein
MIDELLTRGDIQKIVIDSRRHVKVLGEFAKVLGAGYEVDLTPDPLGAFGTVSADRLERQYMLRSPAPADPPVLVSGPFDSGASEDELRRHFAMGVANRKTELRVAEHDSRSRG